MLLWIFLESLTDLQRGLGSVRGDLRRRLPQTIPAQAILAVIRHRQPGGFLGAPAWTRQAAGEFRSASGAGEAARGRIF
jgi:hypothetical protein